MTILRVIPTTERTEVQDYPYGRLRTTVFYSVDFDKKKGFRSVFQSINPKNGVLNKPKKGTYSDVLCNYIEEETGHVKTVCASFNGMRQILKACKFLSKYFEAFTTEQINNMYAHIIVAIRFDAKMDELYNNGNYANHCEQLKPTIDKLNASDGTDNLFSLVLNDKSQLIQEHINVLQE